MIGTAVLARDLPTTIGILARGTRVTMLGIIRGEAKLCLDAPQHLTWRCHTAVVPLTAVGPVHRLRGARDWLPEFDVQQARGVS